MLALNLQLGEHREAVLNIIDRYCEALSSKAEQSDEDRLWRLALHRMDSRSYVADQEASAEKGSESVENASNDTAPFHPKEQETRQVVMRARPPDDDIQAMLDAQEPEQALALADMALLNWGTANWDRENPKTQDPVFWPAKLEEAQKRWRDSSDAPDYLRGGPGLLAAVCARDYWLKMNVAERNWCTEVLIMEVERQADSDDRTVEVSRFPTEPSRTAAHVLPAILGYTSEDPVRKRVRCAIAKALTHSCREVAAFAAYGVATYLSNKHQDFPIQSAGAIAFGANLLNDLAEAQQTLDYSKRLRPDQLVRQVTPQIRAALIEGTTSFQAELDKLNLDGWPAQRALGSILSVVSRCPDEAIAVEVHRVVAVTVTGWWDAKDKSGHRDERHRNFDLELECLERLARFVLRLQPAKAVDVCGPLLEATDGNVKEVTNFVRNCVIVEDQSEATTSFWPIWQAFADRATCAPWIHRLDGRHADGMELIHVLFLGISWKESVHHWHRIEGHASRIDKLFQDLPPCASVLDAYWSIPSRDWQEITSRCV